MLKYKIFLMTAICFFLFAKTYSAPIHPHLSWDELNGSSTTMVVTWKTLSDTSPSRVKYGITTGNYTNTKDGSSFNSSACGYYIHTVKVIGLDPDTLYYYRCGNDTDGWSPESTFKTAPAKGSSQRVRFVAASDTHTDYLNDVQTVLNSIKTQSPDLMILDGDAVTDGGSQSDWNSWFDIYTSLISSTPFFYCDSNHNYSAQNVWDQFVFPQNSNGDEKWYSFNYGNIHFIFLQVINPTAQVAVGSEQYNWLQADLIAADNDPLIKWKFVIYHGNTYAEGAYARNTYVRDTICKLFDQYDVDMVFNGHYHIYERSKKMRNRVTTDEIMEDGPNYQDSIEGVVYVIPGRAGGAPYNPSTSFYTAFNRKGLHYAVVDIEGNLLTLKGYTENGVVIDSCTITCSEASDETPPTVPEAVTYLISGTAKTSGNSGITGVALTLTGTSTGTQTTWLTGTYTFGNLISGTYTITSSKSGYTFTPANRVYTSLNADQTNQDFTGSVINISTPTPPPTDPQDPPEIDPPVVDIPSDSYLDLLQVQLGPNPITFSRVSGGGAGSLMKFTKLPTNSQVMIYTISGKLVRTLTESNTEISFDGKNITGDVISQGMYVYVIKTQKGLKKTGKIAVKVE